MSTEETPQEAARLLKAYEAKAYEAKKCQMSRKGKDSSEKLGRHRWVVERTLSRLNRHRRLKIRYEWRADIHQALLPLGCALTCWSFVRWLR
jgi:hypothetical protein